MVPICKVENIQNMLECGVKTVVVLDQEYYINSIKSIASKWSSTWMKFSVYWLNLFS